MKLSKHFRKLGAMRQVKRAVLILWWRRWGLGECISCWGWWGWLSFWRSWRTERTCRHSFRRSCRSMQVPRDSSRQQSSSPFSSTFSPVCLSWLGNSKQKSTEIIGWSKWVKRTCSKSTSTAPTSSWLPWPRSATEISQPGLLLNAFSCLYWWSVEL